MVTVELSKYKQHLFTFTGYEGLEKMQTNNYRMNEHISTRTFFKYGFFVYTLHADLKNPGFENMTTMFYNYRMNYNPI